MTHCPSNATLARLLFDSLSAAELDPFAEHIDNCAECQDKLMQLTELPDDPLRQYAAVLSSGSQTEDQVVRRLKLAQFLSAPNSLDPEESPTLDAPQGDPTQSATIDFESPSVPGYEISEILGRGGMGVVFKARHLALRGHVALKMLQNWTPVGEKELIRFRAESDVIARLQHPNIVQIFDVGEVAGRPYFVLEYVAGGNLAQHLNGTP